MVVVSFFVERAERRRDCKSSHSFGSGMFVIQMSHYLCCYILLDQKIGVKVSIKKPFYVIY